MLQAKTAGNPFFMNAFLKSLETEKLLWFEHTAWHWDMPRIAQRDFTDNVVDLLADKLRSLPPATREALQCAACIGNRFTLDVPATVMEDTPAVLQAALAQGQLLPVADGEYRFAHDRIQQAAYSLIPDADKPAMHYRIGRLLLDTDSPPVFEVTDQLNAALVLITERAEQRRLEGR